MALVVGELTGVISLDADGVNRGLTQAERAMRTAGQAMGDDAERAGQRAGQQLGDGVTDGLDGIQDDAARAGRQAGEELGDGIVRGADGRLRNARGRFVAAGRAAGDAVGDGLQDGGEEGADQAAESMGDRMKGRMTMAAAGIGAAAGALLMQSFAEALSQGEITARLGAQLGTTPAEAQRYGKLAGQLYTGAIVDTFQDGADTIKAVASAGLIPPGATNSQIKSIAANASDLADLIGVDVTQAASAAGTMIRNGLAKDGREAFDLLVKGSRGLGIASEDVLETFTEYGPVFKSAGLSGQTAMGLMRQAVQGGWGKDTDKIADAFKELSLRVTSGSKASQDALKALGLDSQQVMDDLAAGGAKGEKAMDDIIDSMVELGPETAGVKQAVQELFGGPGEDLGAALFALDVDKAGKSMGTAAGEADKLGNAMRDNAGTKVKQFQRGIQQGVVDFLGGTVIPGMDKFRQYVSGRFNSMWAEAGRAADGNEFADKLVAFFPILGQRLATKARELAPKIIGGIVDAGQAVAEWVMANPTQVLKIAAIAGAITLALVALPALAAAAISTAAISLMVGFVGRLLTALDENLPRWWASFTGWVTAKAGQAGAVMSVLGTAISNWFSGLWSRYVSGPVSRAWASFIASVQALPGRASNALSGLGSSITARASSAWRSFRDSTVQRALGVVSWVRGLPGRIAGAFGNVAGLLYGKGQDVVRGLLNGVRSMGGYLRSQLMSFARSMIPGPIAKALGIASPSKVMAKSVGRWIPRGIVAGIESSSGELDRTMANLVNTPTPSASYAGAVGSAMGTSGSGGGGSVRTATLTAGDALTDQILTLIRTQVGINGGDVQVVLGNTRR
ncbi:phage tail tape measure protein [Streptomyces sp. NPDC096048]|uniref:phage tail tape measure protein n=1 Tax=Streptomyces sp. NPDC096048 TaxID=3366072 RepID=UPI00380958E9